ncbi:hypothetical protein [Xylella fastidiosa]|uniref:hypothetical protein n=1 Tax=Xylella fastidiosa TaxID=2371 RepID=UPI001F24A0AD|nr:hypothetical protein [Xylella fastidiosa]
MTEKFGVPPLMVQVLSVTLPSTVMVPSAAKAVPQNSIAADAMLESAKVFMIFIIKLEISILIVD